MEEEVGMEFYKVAKFILPNGKVCYWGEDPGSISGAQMDARADAIVEANPGNAAAMGIAAGFQAQADAANLAYGYSPEGIALADQQYMPHYNSMLTNDQIAYINSHGGPFSSGFGQIQELINQQSLDDARGKVALAEVYKAEASKVGNLGRAIVTGKQIGRAHV